MAELTIKIAGPDFSTLREIDTDLRRDFINEVVQKKIDTLVKQFQIAKYDLIRENQLVSGLRIRINFDALNQLKKSQLIAEDGIIIHKLQGAKKIESKSAYHFFCINLILGLFIENQSEPNIVEEKFILIKAKSFEDAYKRIEKNAKLYEYEYLNNNMEIAQWKFINMKNCYMTKIQNTADFINPSGNQVFSKILTETLTASNNKKK
jgi:hypothetical protein